MVGICRARLCGSGRELHLLALLDLAPANQAPVLLHSPTFGGSIVQRDRRVRMYWC